MFSSCSMADWDISLNMGIAACLTEKPEPTFPQVCGNKHVERGEECDCGTPEVSHAICFFFRFLNTVNSFYLETLIFQSTLLYQRL